ncbi:MAG: AMP-binding protein [Pseudomonadales bacterium]
MSIAEMARARAHEGMEIAAVAHVAPDRIAIESEAGDRTFRELNQRCNQIARQLRDAGLRHGDAIALLCTNRPEFVEVRFAAHRLGLRLTPVNWHLAPEEVAYIIDNCEAKALFADVRVSDAALAAAQLSEHLVIKSAVGGAINGFLDYEDSLAGFSIEDIDQPSLGTQMLYTSGTTGQPKGVLRDQPDPHAAAAMQELLTAVFQFEPDSGKDRALVTGPLYHSGPFNLCMSTPLVAGIGVVIMDKWEPEKCLELIQQYHITHTFFVPTMFSRLLHLSASIRQAYDISSMRFIIHGAAPIAIDTKRQALDWFGSIIWEMFAGTEGPGTIVSPQEWLAKPGTVGRPGPAQMLICDQQGEQVAAGVEGQIWLVNPKDSSFEYYRSPEKTRQAQQKEGYFTAGDIGLIDEDGYLFITGRHAEVIISGGVNIYPQEIDDILMAHESVADVACVGVPNDDMGEEVKALVQLCKGVAPSEALARELIAFCEAKLAKQKWPRSVGFLDTIARSEAGKVYRYKLRDAYWLDRERKV